MHDQLIHEMNLSDNVSDPSAAGHAKPVGPAGPAGPAEPAGPAGPAGPGPTLSSQTTVEYTIECPQKHHM